MKKFFGAVISVLTVALTAATAMAAEIDITGVGVNADGSVTAQVTVVDAEADEQYSMIVMKVKADGSYDFDDTIYINQLKSGEYVKTADGVSFDINFGVEEEGKYVLKVGATKATADEYPFGGSDEPIDPKPTPIEGLLGDADTNGVLTANDSAVVLNKVLNPEFEVKAEFEIMDVDGDKELTASDSAQILSKVLNSAYSFGAEK